MKKLSRLFGYLAYYKGQIGLYFISSLLAILFGLFSFSMLAPVLQILFRENPEKKVEKATDILSVI